MRFYPIFAILPDSLRVFASFTYCEYLRTSPNTLSPIIADYREFYLILFPVTSYFISDTLYVIIMLPHHSLFSYIVFLLFSRTTLFSSRRYAAILAYSFKI